MKRFKKGRISFWVILLAFAMVFASLPISAFATEVDAVSEEKNSVDIYLSVSHDANYFETPADEIMAFKKMTVPYFDLKDYGLQQYYFVSETYEKEEGTEEGDHTSSLEPGTAETAAGKVTMLHALIYATEVYYCGLDSTDAGQGYLKNQGLIGTKVFDPEGSTGSMYLKQIWGMDENLNYYHNYKYPLASEGWGSTADQILLHDGDIVTVGHFSDWSFHQDPLSVFNLIKAGEEIVITEVEQNRSVDLTVYLAGKGGNYTTAYSPRTEKLAVYYTSPSELESGIVTKWNFLGNADENGNIIVETWMEPGEYFVCVAGQYGKDLPKSIVSTPGGIILKVTEPATEEVLLGDVNGDGTVDIRDTLFLRRYLVDNTYEINMGNADLNEDGDVNIRDVLLLRKALVN